MPYFQLFFKEKLLVSYALIYFGFVGSSCVFVYCWRELTATFSTKYCSNEHCIFTYILIQHWDFTAGIHWTCPKRVGWSHCPQYVGHLWHCTCLMIIWKKGRNAFPHGIHASSNACAFTSPCLIPQAPAGTTGGWCQGCLPSPFHVGTWTGFFEKSPWKSRLPRTPVPTMFVSHVGHGNQIVKMLKSWDLPGILDLTDVWEKLIWPEILLDSVSLRRYSFRWPGDRRMHQQNNEPHWEKNSFSGSSPEVCLFRQWAPHLCYLKNTVCRFPTGEWSLLSTQVLMEKTPGTSNRSRLICATRWLWTSPNKNTIPFWNFSQLPQLSFTCPLIYITTWAAIISLLVWQKDVDTTLMNGKRVTF